MKQTAVEWLVEQVNSDCLNSVNRSIEVEGGGYTAIDQVSFEIIEITNLCEDGQTISVQNTSASNTSTTNSNSTNGGSISENNNTSTSTNSGTVICPVQAYSSTYITESSCEFVWMSNATNSIAADGSLIQQGNYSDQFQFEYKKTSELNWSTIDVSGYQLRFVIQYLSPGTNYQSRLRRVCDEYNNGFSPWRNLNFKTANSNSTNVGNTEENSNTSTNAINAIKPINIATTFKPTFKPSEAP